MEAQSIGDNSVHFNVFIFNTEPGVKINYKTGTSRVTGATSTKEYKKRTVSHKTKRDKKGTVSTAKQRVVGNKRSKIYHVMNGKNYHMSSANAVYFKSEAAARAAGYRKSLR